MKLNDALFYLLHGTESKSVVEFTGFTDKTVHTLKVRIRATMKRGREEVILIFVFELLFSKRNRLPRNQRACIFKKKNIFQPPLKSTFLFVFFLKKTFVLKKYVLFQRLTPLSGFSSNISQVSNSPIIF